ncbi:hypothetical protein CEXT_658181 [Caerostris extrusa]|uniref:Uncharacterized protein n=1 Tax=Caerostris extrusa TaxID=172846 RepID=A0AAV4S0X2_CAEEX|nr:hypothetical protein CEXT_658181 [Caerostris extrusa]
MDYIREFDIRLEKEMYYAEGSAVGTRHSRHSGKLQTESRPRNSSILFQARNSSSRFLSFSPSIGGLFRRAEPAIPTPPFPSFCPENSTLKIVEKFLKRSRLNV